MTDKKFEKLFIKTVGLPPVEKQAEECVVPSIERDVIVLALSKEAVKPNKSSNELTVQETVLKPVQIRAEHSTNHKLPEIDEVQIDYVPRILRENIQGRENSNLTRLDTKQTERLLDVLVQSTASVRTKARSDRQFGGLVRTDKEGNLKVLGRERITQDKLVVTARIEGYRTWIQLLVQSKGLENTRVLMETLSQYEELLGKAADERTIYNINRQFEPYLTSLAEELEKGDLETLVATRGNIDSAIDTVKSLTPAPLIPRVFTKARFAISAKLSKGEVPFFDEVDAPKPVAGYLSKKNK